MKSVLVVLVRFFCFCYKVFIIVEVLFVLRICCKYFVLIEGMGDWFVKVYKVIFGNW